jgi:hypothetical protein
MICNVCKIDKPIDQYKTYFHSTQQKQRTRKECNTCFYGKRNSKKKGMIYIPPQPIKYIQCTGCKKSKPSTDYTFNPSPRAITRCDECRSKSKHYTKNVSDRLKEIEQTQGGYDYFKEPNEYTNDTQKKAVFDIMLSMGWQFNETNGIWWKEGIKTSQGVFLNIKTYLSKEPKKKRIKTTLLIARMKLMRDMKHSYDEIANTFGLNVKTVTRWIKETGNI